MCITGADARADQEIMVWDILCDKCKARAEALLEARKVFSLFDIDKEEYGLCRECAREINGAFERLEKEEFGGGNLLSSLQRRKHTPERLAIHMDPKGERQKV